MDSRRIFAVVAAATTVTAGAAVSASASQDAPKQPPVRGEPQVSTVDNVPTQDSSPKSRSANAGKNLEGGHFVSMNPTRSFDTRRAEDGGALKGGTTRYLTYKKDQIDPRVNAIVFNMSVMNATKDTYVTAWSGRGPVPNASSVTARKGETRSTQVTIPIRRDKNGAAHIALYNHAGSADVITDMAGAYGTGKQQDGETYTGYEPQSPKRVADTRNEGGPVGAGKTRKIDLSDAVAPDTDSVTVNLSAIRPSQRGYLSLFPGDANSGGTSALNTQPGQTTSNQVTVKLGKDKSLKLYNSAGSANVALDLLGSYRPGSENLYYGTDPVRVTDTRNGGGTSHIKGALGSGEETDVPFPGDAEKAVAANATFTGTSDSRPTYVSTWAHGDRPGTANLNLAPGKTASNAAAAELSDGKAKVYNNAGKTHLIVDASGYFAPKSAVEG